MPWYHLTHAQASQYESLGPTEFALMWVAFQCVQADQGTRSAQEPQELH